MEEKKSQFVTILYNNHILLLHPPCSESLCSPTYTDGGILVQLVFGCNPEACAVAAGGPGQIDCRLQLVAHLLVDGASKLGSVIALKIISTGGTSCYKQQNMGFLTKVVFIVEVLPAARRNIFIHRLCFRFLCYGWLCHRQVKPADTKHCVSWEATSICDQRINY